MKRSSFIKDRIAYWAGEHGPSRLAEHYAQRDALAAEAAGVTWDPEKPEVLWEGWPHRYTSEGWGVYVAGDWVPLDIEEPVFVELARRILSEREGPPDPETGTFVPAAWRNRAERAEKELILERSAHHDTMIKLSAVVKAEAELQEEIDKLRCQVKAQSQVIAVDEERVAGLHSVLIRKDQALAELRAEILSRANAAETLSDTLRRLANS